ncbi:MAG: hypothetical protein WHV67_03785 [Thermoanaerobaculia bacterium]
MPYNKNCNLWPKDNEMFFKDITINPIKQTGPHCVSTVLAMLVGEKPETFQKIINTQDPISWSDSLKPYGLKLAYCPTDVRKLKFYIDELIEHNDLFLLCYYCADESKIMSDPDPEGWLCSSHVVILLRDKIIDPKKGVIEQAKDHDCLERHTKRIFRVVPVNYERGL